MTSKGEDQVVIDGLRASTPFRVYVAGSAAPEAMWRVQRAIADLTAAGIQVSCTWPETIAAVGDANPRDASEPQREGWAKQDLAEVAASDAVWFVVPAPQTTRGAWVEAGYAYALGKTLVCSGDTKQSIFCALGHEFPTDGEALDFLVRLAGGRRDRLALEVPFPAEPAAGSREAATSSVEHGLAELRDAVICECYDTPPALGCERHNGHLPFCPARETLDLEIL